ncbi:MAG: methyltransferase domain-containing protein [Candidatus Thorarchaeota archaeon]|nr:MAG: methyltransferase domain-containing protein [Candidatus Thorarchaeota archaeon]
MTGREYATPFSMLHAAMLLGQKTRLAKFDKAIRQIVKPNDYVVDIGTGSGVLALMAAKAGARKVTGIDINQESVEYANEAAVLNGVEDKIEFVEKHVLDFIPDERADVVICEMLSSILFIEQQVPASYHAVENILKPDGVIIPQNATIFIVPVESSVIVERFSFEQLQFPRVVQTVMSDSTKDLADLMVLQEVDFTKPASDYSIDETLQFSIINDGVIHGLVGLFESELYKDIKLNMDDGWKQLFLPLQKPVRVTSGDKFSVRVAYTPGEFNSLVIEHL